MYNLSIVHVQKGNYDAATVLMNSALEILQADTTIETACSALFEIEIEEQAIRIHENKNSPDLTTSLNASLKSLSDFVELE